MAIRTTPEAVRGIVDSDPSIPMEPFIVAASLLVDKVAKDDINRELSADDLAEIERWLAAHCYSMRDRQVTGESGGGVSGSYAGSFGTMLDSTTYGQTAKLLDTTGYLSKLGERKATAIGCWLGKTAPSRRSYDERN